MPSNTVVKNRDTSKWVWDKNKMLIKMGAK